MTTAAPPSGARGDLSFWTSPQPEVRAARPLLGGPSGCSCQPTEAPRPGFVPQPRRVAVRGAAVSPAQSFGVVDMNDELPTGGGESQEGPAHRSRRQTVPGKKRPPTLSTPRCPPQGCETNSVAHRAKRGTTAEVSYGDLWGPMGTCGNNGDGASKRSSAVRPCEIRAVIFQCPALSLWGRPPPPL